MSKGNGTIASVKETSTLVRPMFGPGMLLQHEDLEQLNTYTRDLSRLMFRSLFGCGVVCGLVVTPPVEECGKVDVTITAGLALNCSGDPVHVPKDFTFSLAEKCDSDLPNRLWIVLCGATKHCAPRTSMCASDDDEATSVCTRERDMFEIRVVSEPPKCACGCGEPKEYQAEERRNNCLCADPNLKCYEDHYLGKCGCQCGDGSDCGCECILLARLDKAESKWTADHRVRRFIRPVLMRDPQDKPKEGQKHPMEVELERTRADLQKAETNLEKAESELRLEEAKAAADFKTMQEQVDTLKVENDRLNDRLMEQLGKGAEVKRQKQVQKELPKNIEKKA
jgi:hypothetical protein